MSDKKTGKYKLETENKEQEFWADEIPKTEDIDQQKMKIMKVGRKKMKRMEFGRKKMKRMEVGMKKMKRMEVGRK